MDKKRQAHLNHIEENIFDRPSSTNLKMWIMQIILNAIIGQKFQILKFLLNF